jgi:hypothetical protein
VRDVTLDRLGRDFAAACAAGGIDSHGKLLTPYSLRQATGPG